MCVVFDASLANNNGNDKERKVYLKQNNWDFGESSRVGKNWKV